MDCGYRLRNGPRSFKFKAKLRQRTEKQIQEAKNKNNITLLPVKQA
jgi:hypothetical protein